MYNNAKIVIGGSRAITYLSASVKDLIDTLTKKGYTILVGDANGADKATQKYLYAKGYHNVVVYCMYDLCRNNVGKWPTKRIVTPNKKKDANYFGTKDLHMARESDFGIMIWDGNSKGTFRNVINLLDDNKRVYVYYHPSKRVSLISSTTSLNNLLKDNTSKNGVAFRTELRNRLQTSTNTTSECNTHEKASIQGTFFAEYKPV